MGKTEERTYAMRVMLLITAKVRDLIIMGRPVVLFVTFMCYYNIFFVDKAQCTRNLYKEEELDLEIQSKISKKSSIKAIQDNYGDINCVDVYKQLAFQHPLLKNHTIDRQIISSPLYYKSSEHNISTASTTSETYLKHKMCPIGTIPIRRITKRNRAKVINREHTLLAVTRTEFGTWTGGRGYIRQDNPRATGHQYSATRIRIQAGHNSIEAGWRVDPDLYGDSLARFFIRTDAGNTHCFNLRCPGFIQTHRGFPLDSIIKPISTPERQLLLPITIFRESATGNWKLRVGDIAHASDIIGYWPSKIFPGKANRIEWGGVAYSPPGTPLPPMGTGDYVTGKLRNDGFITEIIAFDNTGEGQDPDLHSYADDSKRYSVRDWGSNDKGHTILYGGPGEY